MTIALIVVLQTLALMYILVGRPALAKHIAAKRAAKALPPKPAKVALSLPAKRLVKLFEELPQENRPSVDIYEALRALDIKEGGIEKVDQHFSDYGRGFTWNCDYLLYPHSYPGGCPHSEYHALKKRLTAIKAELAERERQEELASAAGGIHEYEVLLQSLTDEHKAIKSVNQQMRELT